MQDRALDYFNMGCRSLSEGQLKSALNSFAACIAENSDRSINVVEYLESRQTPLATIVLSKLNAQIKLLKSKTPLREPVGTLARSLKPTVPFASAIQDGNATGIPSPNNEHIRRARKSVLIVYNRLQFTSLSDPQIMSEELFSGYVQQIGYATMIGQRRIISARHIFNESPIGHFILYSPATKLFYQVGLIEDGANFKIDYIIAEIQILDLEQYDSIPKEKQYPPFIKMAQAPAADCDIALLNWHNTLMGPKTITQVEQLSEITTFDTEPGDSGSPYIGPDGRMFALHCKRSDNPLNGRVRTGVLLEQISKTSAHLQNLRANTGPTNFDYVFNHFSTVAEVLSEKDESGDQRDAALGGNPTVKAGKPPKLTSTARQVLLRFYNNGKAKFYYEGNGIEFKIKKTKGFQFLKPANKKKQAIIREQFNDIEKLIKDKKFDEHWFVKLYSNQNAGKRTYTKLLFSENDLEIHMGHKIPAICFWRYGADGNPSYKQKRLANVNNNIRGRGKVARKENVKQLKIAQINKVDSRYNRYKISGVISYGNEGGRSQYIKDFMYDSSNYTFQVKEVNEGNSHTEKAVYGSYTQSVPTDFQWKKGGESWQLISAPGVINYHQFPQFDDAFQIELADHTFAPINSAQVAWPTKAQITATRLTIGSFINKLSDHGVHVEISKQTLSEPRDKKWAAAKTKLVANPNAFFKFIDKGDTIGFTLTKSNGNPKRDFERCETILKELDDTIAKNILG